MGLEAGTTISSFITSNPTETDPVNQGDNHIRLIKAVLQAQFPGSGGLGFNTAITTTETELNSLHNSGIENLVASVHVDGSGNVGIGTASPPYKLSVTGDSFLSYTGSSGLLLRNLSGINRIDSYNYPITATYPLAILGSYITLSTSDVERMRISSTGIVTMNAYGAGAATFSASGVISSVSDETWKIKDGIPVNPDEMIQKLKPGYWFYNAEKSPIFGTDRQLGFYAQNVNEAIGIEAAPVPEEGKPWGYYDRSVLAVAVMSLQKALTTIESLTERLTALENK